MDKKLAAEYADYDNTLKEYFDRVLLDLATPQFRMQYHLLRRMILEGIFRDLHIDITKPIAETPEYVRHPDYDDQMFHLVEHYFTVLKTSHKAGFEVEGMMIDHYLELCGYRKNTDGYWLNERN